MGGSFAFRGALASVLFILFIADALQILGTIFVGGGAGGDAEFLDEIAGVGEACIQRHVGDGQSGGYQNIMRLCKSYTRQIFLEGLAHNRAKELGKIAVAQMNARGAFGGGNIGGVVFVDVFHTFVDQPHTLFADLSAVVENDFRLYRGAEQRDEQGGGKGALDHEKVLILLAVFKDHFFKDRLRVGGHHACREKGNISSFFMEKGEHTACNILVGEKLKKQSGIDL